MTGMKKCTCCREFKGVEDYRKSDNPVHTYEYRCNQCLDKFGRNTVKTNIHGVRYALPCKKRVKK